MVLEYYDIEKVINIVVSTRDQIMRIYNSAKVEVTTKDDNSPVTSADRFSHRIITTKLEIAFPDIPIISEESQEIPFDERKYWDSFWLLDPLDGTKEFLSKRDEFTVNLCLIDKGFPILGIVYAPALELLYFAHKAKGSFKRSKGSRSEAIRVRRAVDSEIIFARSRSHADPKEEEVISKFDKTKVISAGSSLKFCYVAEGAADIYLRTSPTREWDTAAGQCIAECAGARVCDLEGKRMQYNKESLKNPHFLCIGSRRDLLDKTKTIPLFKNL